MHKFICNISQNPTKLTASYLQFLGLSKGFGASAAKSFGDTIAAFEVCENKYP